MTPEHAPLRRSLALFAAVLVAACSGGRPTLQLDGTSAPPRFKLGGGGQEVSFFVVGPFKDEAALRSKAPGRPRVVHLSARDKTASPSSFAPFTYGPVPPGFRSIVFDQDSTKPREITSPPKALEPGSYYEASVSTHAVGFVSAGYPTARVCFLLRTADVVPVPCD